MRRLRPLALLLTCSGACSGGASTPPPGGPEPATGRLTGTVRGPDRAPLAGAQVASGTATAVTQGDGTYQLDLPEGGAVVVVTRAGRHDEVGVAAVRPAGTQLDFDLAASDGTIDLAFTGDLAFASRTRALPDDEAGWAALVEPIAPLTRAADLAVVNLESVLADAGTPHPARPVILRSPPASAAALKALGVDVVGLANDHIYDNLDDGVLATLDNLRAAGLTPLGAGKNLTDAQAVQVVTRNGVRVGLVAFSLLTGRGEELAVAEAPFFDATAKKAGAARMNVQRLDAAVAELRGRADKVVVLLHGGRERGTTPALDVATAAHRAIDAGADLVVCTHPRAPQGVERYKDKLVFYSLGGFALDDDEPEGWTGAVLRVRFSTTTLVQARLHPVYTEGLVPAAAAGATRAHILDLFAERSAALGVTVLTDGRVLAVPPGEVPSSDDEEERTVPVDPSEGGFLSLADDVGGDRYLTRIELLTPPDGTLWLGRDLLAGGEVEDDLADGRYGAPVGWRFPSDAEQIVTGGAQGGRLSLSVCRSGTARDTASAESSGRYPVAASGTMTVCGCWRGDAGSTGAVKLVFYDSLAEDASSVGTSQIVAGSPPADWSCFCHVAAGPRGTRFAELRVEHTPTADHSACIGFDAMRLVSWEAADGPVVDLAPANDAGYVRVTGAGGLSEALVVTRRRTLEAP